jgi:16S rRNA (cytidine1402-2'-O)-methyltransferase
MTFRAVKVLREADIILAEDTRKTLILLKHYSIQSHLESYHKFNEHRNTERIVERISEGKTVALVSDAGTPGISDPGFLLVRNCIEKGINVECLPGATALIPAIVDSGLPCDRFCFEGFLPQKKGRQKRIAQLVDEERTVVFYESPYRTLKCLEQFAEFFGEDRKVSVSRELSKIHEETVNGTLAEVITHFKTVEPRGEIVIVLEGKKTKQLKTND